MKIVIKFGDLLKLNFSDKIEKFYYDLDLDIKNYYEISFHLNGCDTICHNRTVCSDPLYLDREWTLGSFKTNKDGLKYFSVAYTLQVKKDKLYLKLS